MTILVTGGAGFIGSNLVDKLLELNYHVISVDNFDLFYNRTVKEDNIRQQLAHKNFQFVEGDICDPNVLQKINNYHVEVIVHLAAKAGVRPSISNPETYNNTNVQGTIQLLEFAKRKKVPRFILASSSSVYGKNPNIPWSETDKDLDPISPYAASKIAAENFAKVYAHLYAFQVVVLRFFTVYGPRQRPDLAIHKFFNSIHQNEPITFYGDGSTSRDYTYIDDIVQGILGAIHRDNFSHKFEVYNLGNSHPVTLKELVENISKVAGKEFQLSRLPLQEGDVNNTYSQINKATIDLNYHPSTTLQEGLKKFSEWYSQQNAKNDPC
jgi:UDP-glucuronate 4-epimerase